MSDTQGHFFGDWEQREISDPFDARASAARKETGMQRAEEAASPSPLDLAREIARELAKQRGSVTADDVGELLHQRHQIESLGPAAGSLFKGSEWETTGEMRKSTRKTNHSRLLYVWRLKSANNSA